MQRHAFRPNGLKRKDATAKEINSRRVWYRRQVNKAFEALPSKDDRNPWDEDGGGPGLRLRKPAEPEGIDVSRLNSRMTAKRGTRLRSLRCPLETERTHDETLPEHRP
jgi:hypothetical protein